MCDSLIRYFVLRLCVDESHLCATYQAMYISTCRAVRVNFVIYRIKQFSSFLLRASRFSRFLRLLVRGHLWVKLRSFILIIINCKRTFDLQQIIKNFCRILLHFLFLIFRWTSIWGFFIILLLFALNFCFKISWLSFEMCRLLNFLLMNYLLDYLLPRLIRILQFHEFFFA